MNSHSVAFTLLTLAAPSFAQVGCDSGDCQFRLTGDTTCWEMTDSGCTATPGSPRYDDDAPGAPEALGSQICDACDTAQDQSVDYSYAKTTGIEYCLTISETAGISLPAGPGWEMGIEHQFCFNGQTTETTTAKVNCKAGTKVEATFLQTRTTGTVSIDVAYSKWANFTKQDPFPVACFDPGTSTRREEIACGSETLSSAYAKYDYTADFDDLPCPVLPGECDKYARSVYSTTEESSTEIRHDVEELIPCYYNY